MKAVLLLAICAAGALAASSSGCGKSPPASGGKTTSMSGTFDGTKRSWLLYVPAGYSSSKAYPLVISHHGWGGSGSQDQSGSGLASQAASKGFIVAFPNGFADNSNKGSWGSWNCVGTTQSPGSQGQICTSWADSSNEYCYDSCGGCKGAGGCDWTTCKSDVTPTGVGTKSVDGFIPQLYDYIEANFCVDTTREYAAGFSNGAMMTYQLGASMSSRLAAIAPVAGSFHNGFDQSPTSPLPVYDIHGTKDTTVPGCKSSESTCVSGDGWYYTGTQYIAKGWAAVNGCSGSDKTYRTSYDGTSGLSCKVKGSCSKGDVVSCTWSGSHTYFGSSSSKNGALVWELLSKNANALHLGCGRTAASDPPCAPLKLTGVQSAGQADGAVAPTEFPLAQVRAGTPAQCALSKCGAEASACLADAGCKTKVTCALACTTKTCIDGCAGASPDAATSALVACAVAQGCVTSAEKVVVSAGSPRPSRGTSSSTTHYGNPGGAGGCLADEDALTLDNGGVSGTVCAPRKQPGVAGARTFGANKAPCGVGGQAPSDNGCPLDVPAPSSGAGAAAWPDCKFDVTTPNFHCTQACGPCRDGSEGDDASGCSAAAHGACAAGARCVAGFDRNVRQGVCLYNVKVSKPVGASVAATASTASDEQAGAGAGQAPGSPPRSAAAGGAAGAVALVAIVVVIAVALHRRKRRAAAPATDVAPAPSLTADSTPEASSYAATDTFDDGTARVSFSGGAAVAAPQVQAVSL